MNNNILIINNISKSLYQNDITKSYETKVDILELWKKQNKLETPTNYETLIREREKNI